eukprot:scaffold519_cov30-Tisochrysis_lutea.AAC.1
MKSSEPHRDGCWAEAFVKQGVDPQGFEQRQCPMSDRGTPFSKAKSTAASSLNCMTCSREAPVKRTMTPWNPFSRNCAAIWDPRTCGGAMFSSRSTTSAGRGSPCVDCSLRSRCPSATSTKRSISTCVSPSTPDIFISAFRWWHMNRRCMCRGILSSSRPRQRRHPSSSITAAASLFWKVAYGGDGRKSVIKAVSPSLSVAENSDVPEKRGGSAIDFTSESLPHSMGVVASSTGALSEGSLERLSETQVRPILRMAPRGRAKCRR